MLGADQLRRARTISVVRLCSRYGVALVEPKEARLAMEVNCGAACLVTILVTCNSILPGGLISEYDLHRVLPLMRPVHILFLASFLVYSSPLRTCILQQWMVGSSCHDQDLLALGQEAGDAQPVSGCVPHPKGGHPENCVCQQPKPSPDRSHLGIIPADLPDPMEFLLAHVHPMVVGDVRDDETNVPESPPLALSLPLLN